MENSIRKNSYLESLYQKYGEDFFKEEIRSDFLVTTKRKEIWAVDLDILEHFIQICSLHDLHYFIAFGSLLGAVRHGGFIPWDDDLDILMPRDDYDNLMEYKDEFSYPFFLQTPETDSSYAGSYARLRNSETAFLDPAFLRKNDIMNMGMALDIFVLDKIHKENADKIQQEILPLTMQCAAYMKHGAVTLTDQDRMQVAQYYDKQIIPTDLYKKINDIASQYREDITADYWTMSVNTIYDIHRKLWPESYFAKTVQIPFEGVMVSAPFEYDKCLKTTFGNYNELPPVSERGQWHSRIIIRPDVPYLQAIDDYLAGIEGEKD